MRKAQPDNQQSLINAAQILRCEIVLLATYDGAFRSGASVREASAILNLDAHLSDKGPIRFQRFGGPVQHQSETIENSASGTLSRTRKWSCSSFLFHPVLLGSRLVSELDSTLFRLGRARESFSTVTDHLIRRHNSCLRRANAAKSSYVHCLAFRSATEVVTV